MKPAMEAAGVGFSYRRRIVLDGMNLRVHTGDFIGFLGPNGSGKTTFLKNLLGYLKSSSGTILCSGMDIRSASPSDLSRAIAFVPQQTSLRSPITVTEAVVMGRLPHLKDRWTGYSKTDFNKTYEVISALGLSALAERPVTCLSGGELQKVVLARCLVQESDIFLLDEATAGLDLNHSVEIMELMRKKANNEKKAIVAVLHDINLACSYCDRIALIKGGKIRYEGPPAEVITADILEDVFSFRAKVGYLDDGTPFVLPRRGDEIPLQMDTESLHVC